jgi:hypothetical protein
MSYPDSLFFMVEKVFSYTTLKMKAADSSGTMIMFYQTTRRHTPGDSNLHMKSPP